MAYQTEVPVESEAAREVLSSIILQRLYTLVGPDGVYEADLDDPDTDLMAAADRAIGLPFGARAEVSDVLDRLDEHLEKITALRSDVQALLTSDATRIAVHLSREQIADGLDTVCEVLEEYGSPSPERASRDAAARILQTTIETVA
jgi:hypothetical protein